MQDPSGYLRLLLSLFRALSVGKFATIYELFGGPQLLQPTLAAFQAMLRGPGLAHLRETLLELCLIMPTRLSDMLAVLPQLMQPLVMALRSSEELVTLGALPCLLCRLSVYCGRPKATFKSYA